MPTVGRTGGSAAVSLSPRFLPAYLAAIVLGILGMHALAQHCPAPLGELPIVGASISAGVPAQHAHHAAAAASPAIEAGPRALSIMAGQGGLLDDLLMLCAAMLVGAGATLAWWLHKRGSAVGLFVSRLRDAVRRPAWIPRATGPPPALAFAVIRC